MTASILGEIHHRRLSAGIDPRFFAVLHFSATRPISRLMFMRSVLSTVTYWNESPCADTRDRILPRWVSYGWLAVGVGDIRATFKGLFLCTL